MTEIRTPQIKQTPQSVTDSAKSMQTPPQRAYQNVSCDEFWRKEKRKNTGLIERLYNKLKNATGLGIGSKQVETKLKQANEGKISEEEFKNTVKKYNASQEISAQSFGDLMSIGAAGLTYFGLRNEAKLHHAGKQLNEKFGSKNIFGEVAETAGSGINLKTMKKAISKVLAHMATSKTKLAVFTAAMAASVGGAVKMHVLQLNRIGSQEFKTNKNDFNGAKNDYDRAAYKGQKRLNRLSKLNSNLRNFASGAINGLLMPLSVVGGAFVGIPAYFAGNVLNRHFIGQRHSDKSVKGLADSFTNDGITNAAIGAATLIPMAKKGRFSAIFDKNLKLAFDEINAHTSLIDNPYHGKSSFEEISDILFESPKIKSILEGRTGLFDHGMSVEDQIRALSEENIFAVKLKQIQSGDDLATALQENCPATRTLKEAAQEIKSKLEFGSEYKVIENMGTGTIAETYLVETPEGKQVCIKMLKKGIDENKILEDEKKFIDIINGLTDKTDAEKRYLIKNVQNLAESVKKEIDFFNEKCNAEKLVKYTKTANVVEPKKVVNGLYIMEKAKGISLKKLLEINRADSIIKSYERRANQAKNQRDKDYWLKAAEELRKEKGTLADKYKDLMLTEQDVDYLINEYMKVLIEQLYKTGKEGRTLHADIHPGNIFIDVEALKARKGRPFTLIDTGNTIDLTAEQAERSMRLTQYIERGDTKDLAKYFIEDADLSASKLTKEQAEQKIEEALNKVFFDSEIRLNTMNNTEIINLTSNIMKKLDIMPGDTQFALNKARTSANQSFMSLLEIWLNEAMQNIAEHGSKSQQMISGFGKVGKLIKKVNEYLELQQEQERKNLMQMIKSPKEFFKSQNNPNYKPRNSKDYLIYHLKQDIRKDKDIF